MYNNIYSDIPTENNNFYPVLRNAPEEKFIKNQDQSYRLQKIGEIQKEIEREREKRITLSKKYHRAVTIISVINNALLASTMTLGTIGIGFLFTIIAAPVVIACEGAALGAGMLSIIGGQINKKMNLKAEKHEKIKVLADSKLNTISNYISKALVDGHIDDKEFELILGELEKFQTMMEQIRIKVKNEIDEQTKLSLIDQGREEAIKVIQSRFNKKIVT